MATTARIGSPGLRRAALLLGILALAAAGLVVDGIQASGPPHLLLLCAYPVLGLGTIWLGLWLWVRRPANRIGSLTVIAGIVMLLASAFNTTSTVATFVGAMLALAPLAALLHILLAFPSGVILERCGRCMVWSGYAIAILPELPVYLFTPDLAPGGTPYPGHEWAARAADQIQAWTWFGLMLSVAVLLIRRWRAGGTFVRRPALAIAYAYGWLSIMSVPLTARVIAPTLDWSPFTLFGVQIAQLALVPVVLVISVALGGFGRTLDLAELGAWLGAGERRPSPAAAIGRALGDPSAQLLYEVPGSSFPVDERGTPVALPPEDGTRRTAPVVGPRGSRAHLVYDAELNADRAMVESVAQVLALAIDHERLTVELRAREAEVRASRRRLVEETARTRRQVAQDLHDGAQTRLLVAAMQLGQAADSLEGEPGELLQRARGELDEAISELRRVANGLAPSLLVERGLYAAVDDLVERMPLKAHLEVSGDDADLPWSVASGAYFIVSEAVANVLKHAQASTTITRLERGPARLRIVVADDGRGGICPTLSADGRGLRGMADRAAALGGTFDFESPVGQGTTIRVEVPCES